MPELVDIFMQPSQVLAAQRERPTFLVPVLLIAVLSPVFSQVYVNRVDPAWHEAQMVAAAAQDLSAK